MFVNLNDADTFDVNTKSVDTLPSGFIFKPEELPLKVQFAWKNGSGCPANKIIITKIKRR